MDNKLDSVIQQLKNYPDILAVFLFGSTVSGLKSPLSDLDIGVIFHQPQNIFNNPKNSLKMYEQLFDIFAPLVSNSNQLDLVFLQTASLAVQKEAVMNGELIYCQDINKLLDYKEKVLLKFADIKPLLNQFYQEVYQTRL